MSPNRPIKLRKHRKTFTGCWTCRSRKVKCDEDKPACRRCRQRGLECQGYGVKLQWVTNDVHDADLSSLFVPRGNIRLDSERPPLSAGRVDEILNILASSDPRHKKANESHVPLSIQGFGVFSADIDQGSEHTNITQFSKDLVEGEAIESISSTPREDLLASLSWTLSPFPLFQDLQTDQPTSTIPDQIEDVLYSLDNPPTNVNVLEDEGAMHLMLDHDNWTDSNSNSLETLEEDNATHPSSWAGDILMGSPLLLRPSPNYLSRKERFLMHHYSHRVVHRFCVIDYHKSPWKTIHLPKVLQTAGELSIHGSTSTIREALRNAILCISAFHLSNGGGSELQINENLDWKTTAYTYRCKAIELLRDVVEKDLHSSSPPKYKDFLATALSMITINVISGDTNTSRIHLDGALRLIKKTQRRKEKYSTKAQALHGIYVYLRAIYESTAPRYSREDHGRFSVTHSAEGDLGSSPGFFKCLLPSTTEERLSMRYGLEIHTTGYESIYGIPYSLLFLLIRAIDLIDKLYHDGSGTNILENLVEECDSLEENIMEWSKSANLDDITRTSNPTSSKIILHHTLAFHNALIIYFAQHIRFVGHRFLEPYVRAVLDNMEAIENLKRNTSILSAPLYWPAFIAASEAYSNELQTRFRRWYEHVEVYRFEALRTGISVLEEVWRNGPVSGRSRTSAWRDVIEKSGQHLMLS